MRQRRTSAFSHPSFATRTTITRVSFARRYSQLPKYVRNAKLKCVLNAGRGRRRRPLRNVRGGRGVTATTRGTASPNVGSEAGTGTCPTREKIGGSRQRSDGMMKRKESAVVLGLRASLGETRKVHPGAVDTVLVPLRTTRIGRSAGGGGDTRRGAGARMESTSGVLVVEVKHLPGVIDHVLP